MANISALEQAVHKAIALHQAGNLDAAQKAYEAILRQHPRDANVLMNLGTLLAGRGQPEEGAKLLKRLINFYPKLPQPHFGYGNVMMALERNDEALASFDRAIALAPGAIDAHYNRGITLMKTKRFAEALTSYEQVLALDPAHARAFCNRIAALNYVGRYSEAMTAMEHPFAQTNEDPAWLPLTRGTALYGMGQMQDAIGEYSRAIALDDRKREAYTHRANALNDLHRYEEALQDMDMAMALGENSAFGHNIRAVALNRTGRYQEAETHYTQAIAHDPGLKNSYWNLAIVKLMLGNYAEGLPLYEWRWKVGPQKGELREDGTAFWHGESLEGKSICIEVEQGLGDFIQCARYLPLLQAQGATIILETPAALMTLIAENVAGMGVTMIKAGDPLPPTDYYCPIMSLPLAFGVTLETIPNQVPYLHASAQKIAEWQGRLGDKTRRRVGLVWSGGPRHLYDHLRSIPLEMLQPLLQQNVEFHALQKEFRAADMPHLSGMQVHDSMLQDFGDTAALVAQMDLVISVDTSVAHLAGALGKPVWVLLPYVPDYRWLLEREDSPLYPTARLFRQTAENDWAGVVARGGVALAEGR